MVNKERLSSLLKHIVDIEGAELVNHSGSKRELVNRMVAYSADFYCKLYGVLLQDLSVQLESLLISPYRSVNERFEVVSKVMDVEVTKMLNELDSYMVSIMTDMN